MDGMSELLAVGGLIAQLGLIAASFILAVICRRNIIVIGFCAAIAVAVFSVSLCGIDKIRDIWDMPSVLLVVFTVIILVSGQRKWKLFWQGLQTSVSASIPNTSDAAETAALFRYIANGTLWGGGLWALTSWIIMLNDLDLDTIGAGIGVSLLTLFYSLMVSVFLFRPIAYRYEQAVGAEIK
jgi:flagellar motor component MotA